MYTRKHIYGLLLVQQIMILFLSKNYAELNLNRYVDKLYALQKTWTTVFFFQLIEL